MTLQFDIRKAVAAATVVCQRAGGAIDIIYLVKMLYVADREALLRWRRPITGDSFASLPLGPIVSRCYDLMRGRAMGPEQKIWFSTFRERKGNKIELVNPADHGPLSQREIDLLIESHDRLVGIPVNDMIDYLHKMLPEWRDPGDSSFPIQPEEILHTKGWTPEQVSSLERELSSLQSFKAALSAF